MLKLLRANYVFKNPTRYMVGALTCMQQAKSIEGASRGVECKHLRRVEAHTPSQKRRLLQRGVAGLARHVTPGWPENGQRISGAHPVPDSRSPRQASSTDTVPAPDRQDTREPLARARDALPQANRRTVGGVQTRVTHARGSRTRGRRYGSGDRCNCGQNRIYHALQNEIYCNS